MKKESILDVICQMVKDDNKGVMMTNTILGAGSENKKSYVTFQVADEIVPSAFFQSMGGSGDYICCAFFIDRKELKKYENK